MSIIEILAASIFIIGYLLIALEHKLLVNKAASGLLLATVLWILVSLSVPVNILQEATTLAGSDLFSLVIFLLASMTLVEILVHYRLFDVIEQWLRSHNWTRYQLGWAVAILTFVFSMFVANLTAAIVAIQIARRLFAKKELLIMGVVIVICANAGGAFSPIGDVVTLLLWFAGKFTSLEILIQGALPSIALAGISTALLLRSIPAKPCEIQAENGVAKPSRSDWAIIAATLGSFFLPLFAAFVKLPPYFGLLAGLGLVWLLIDVAKTVRPQETHLQAKISKFLQMADIEAIQFFVGILLAVAALHSLGVLDMATHALLGNDPSIGRLVAAFTGLGFASAIVDNVPITAAAISSVHNVSNSLWVLLSITVGTGGSLLVIGSAAGIVAMGMIRKLDFFTYMRIGLIPGLIGFLAGVAIWYGQYWLFFS